MRIPPYSKNYRFVILNGAKRSEESPNHFICTIFKRRRKTILGVFGTSQNIFFRSVFLLFVTILVWGCNSSEVLLSPYIREQKFHHGNSSLAFISDTQAPLWIEKFWLEYDNNEEATSLILHSIATDTTCAAVFHLGDITGLGSFSSYWEEFDAKAEVLKNAGIPLFPAAGNHEYMPFDISGKRHFLERFPFAGGTWYSKQIGRVAVILLNSNFGHLSDEEIERQQQWYKETLSRYDNDPTVSCVIVGCHHPPYTNSTIVDSSMQVQKNFVVPFMNSTKAKLFVTGHSHASEHFKVNGKDFLVLGGGGGLLHPLRRERDANRYDLIKHDSDRAFFHYARLFSADDKLTVQILKVNDKRTACEIYTSFEVAYNPSNEVYDPRKE